MVFCTISLQGWYADKQMRGRFFEKAKRIVFGFTALALLLVTVAAGALPAKAAGDPIFELKSGTIPEVIRLNETTLTIFARLKISEDGVQDETFAFFDIKETLTKQSLTSEQFDYWRVTQVEMSNLSHEESYGRTSSRLISPQVADFRNRNNEQVVLIDYTSLPKDAQLTTLVPCLTVNRSQQTGTNEGSGNTCSHSPSQGTGRTPAGRLGFELQASPREVENYDLTDGGASSDINESRVRNWFAGQTLNGLTIQRFEEAGKAPYIDVPAGSSGNSRPVMRFVLSHIGSEGSGWFLWNNVDWFVFQAYRLNNGQQGDIVKHLYIVANDELGINVVYDKDRAGVEKGKFVDISDDLSVTEASFNRFFGYVYRNVPKDNFEENCGKEDLYTVGPTGSDYKHYDEITGRPDPARELNGNCIVPGAGWPQLWGIGVASVPFEKSQCELSELVSLGGIGESFNKALDCLFNDVFSAITSEAQEWVTRAAGEDLGKNITDPDGFVFEIWKVSRSLINILLIIALLAISFSNILHGSFGIKLDSYTVKQALPKLFLGIILANASFLMIRFLIDIANVVMNYFAVDLAGRESFGGLVSGATQLIAIESIKTIGAGLGIVAPLIAVMAALVSFVLLAWLAFLLYFRLVAVYLLTILAPVTFVAYGLPGLGGFFGKWWQQFVKWIFMVPAMAVVFWLMIEIGERTTEESIAQLIIMYILFIVALTLPTKWGGTFINGASQAFAKYTGLNAAREGAKKWAGDTAKLAGESAMTKVPGLRAVTRYQEWSKLKKKNWEEGNRLARERLTQKASSGRSWLSAGRKQGRLSLIDQELKESAAKITADNIKAAAEADPKLLNRLLISELQKVSSEKRLEELKKLHRLDSLKKGQISEDDMDKVKAGERRFVKEMGKVLEEFADATADEQIISGEVGREEGIINGNKMNQLYQIPQALENYKKHRLETVRAFQAYKAAKGTAGEADAKAKYLAAKESRDSVAAAFDALKVKDEHRYIGSQDLSKFSIKQAVDLLDEEAAGKLLGSAELGARVSRLTTGQLRQGYKAFSAGVLGQIKDEVKEQTVSEIQDELREFLEKDLAKVADGDATKLRRLQQAFFRGDTATLAAEGAQLHKIRGGLVVAEKYKTVLKSTNDVRHAQALESWMNQANQVLEAEEQFTQDEMSMGMSTDTKDRRAIAGEVLSFGPMGRGVGKRQEYGGDRARQQNAAVKKRNQGGQGSGGRPRGGGGNQGGGGQGGGPGTPSAQPPQFTQEDIDYANQFLGGGVGTPPDITPPINNQNGDEEEENLEEVEAEIEEKDDNG